MRTIIYLSHLSDTPFHACKKTLSLFITLLATQLLFLSNIAREIQVNLHPTIPDFLEKFLRYFFDIFPEYPVTQISF